MLAGRRQQFEAAACYVDDDLLLACIDQRLDLCGPWQALAEVIAADQIAGGLVPALVGLRIAALRINNVAPEQEALGLAVQRISRIAIAHQIEALVMHQQYSRGLG